MKEHINNLENNKPNIFICTGWLLLMCVMMARQLSLLINGTSSLATTLFKAAFVIFFVVFGSVFISNINKSSFVFSALIVIVGLVFLLVGTRALSRIELLAPFLLSVCALCLLNMGSCYVDRVGWMLKIYVIAVSVLLILEAGKGGNYTAKCLLYYTENPNQSAILCFSYFVNVFYFRFDEKKKMWLVRLFYDALLVGVGYAIIKTQSRTIMLCVLLLFLFKFFPFKKREIWIIATYIALFLAFLFPYIVSTIISFLGEGFLLFGETVETGRELVWKNAIPLVWRNVFGVHFGKKIPMDVFQYYSGVLDSHNAFLGIAWNYSAVVSVLFLAVVFLSLRRLFRYLSNEKISRMAPYLLVIFIHMAFETSLFGGAFDYTILCLFPILCILNKGYKKDIVS